MNICVHSNTHSKTHAMVGVIGDGGHRNEKNAKAAAGMVEAVGDVCILNE